MSAKRCIQHPGMIEWRQVPWTLWVIAAAMLWSAARIELGVHQPVLAMVLYPAVVLGWIYSLFRGVRWVWLVTIAVYVLGFGLDLVSGSIQLWAWTISLIEFALLLLPITRHHFEKHRATAVDGV